MPLRWLPCASLLLAMACRAAPAATFPGDAFAHTIDSLRQAARIPGLALAVVENGRIVLQRGFGFADVEQQRPVTDSTPFNIASVSKTVAGIVALRLVEQGKLDLDRPMHTFANFTEFCADTRDGPPIFFRDFTCRDSSLTLRHVLSMEANGTRPGEKFWYNPISFSWASRPLREVGGAPYSDLVQQLVFVPAAMHHSARIHRDLPLRADLAADLPLTYQVDSAGALVRSPGPDPQGDGAAGGVISTAHDLALMDIALDGGKLLSDSSRRVMWQAGKASDGTVLPYGIGWFVGSVNGEPVYWHTGLWENAWSALYLKLPERKRTLILLANSDGLRWEHGLGEAVIERSPFAQAFLQLK